MDFDLEIISEESDHSDPLFDSIMTAMNSMKEATADKIYRKIQKEGATNYSKPQVDRALASALKYGIFEVRNNRYRVRDDVLDDEDTVYWKMQKKKEQSPFRIEEDTYDTQYGQKLNPEKDNRRFKSPSNKECLHCGRLKKGYQEQKKIQRIKKEHSKYSRKGKKSKKEKPKHPRHEEVCDTNMKLECKRKKHSHESEEDQYIKKRKLHDIKFQIANDPSYYVDDSQEMGNDSSDSEVELLNSSEHSLKGYPENKKIERRPQDKKCTISSECIKANGDYLKQKWSSISLRSATESEKTYSSASEGQSQTRTPDGYYDDYPCNSRNDDNEKLKDQYLTSFGNHLKKPQMEKEKGNPDWLECSDEPQGAIIQSNNVLTIEPMDSLSFKSPEHATYIS